VLIVAIADFIYKGLIYDKHGLRKATIVVDNGVIADIKNINYNGKSEAILDYHNDPNVVAFPGFIDMHVHMRDFEQKYKETVDTGTKAAAHGGITVLGDMPNTVPQVRSLEVLYQRKHVFNRESHVDYYLYIGVPYDVNELPKMIADDSVKGVKIYPTDLSGYSPIFESLKIAARYGQGKIIILHPEDEHFLNEPIDLFDTLIHRGIDVELWSIRKISDILWRLKINMHTHVTHITNPYSIIEAKRNNFTIDTCPHYLFLSVEKTFLKHCLAKVYPPLRSEGYRRLLLDAFLHGYIDAITSDHAPHSLIEKSSSFLLCPGGINGIELTAPLLGSLVALGFISLDHLYRMLSYNPAKILNLRKYGRFCIGCRGNLTIMRFNTVYAVDPDKFFSKAKYSIYDGWSLFSRVEATVIGGKIVFHDDVFFEDVKGLSVGVVESW